MGRSCQLVVAILAALASLTVANLHDEWAVEWGPQNAKYTDDGSSVALSLVSSSSGCRLRTKTPFLYGSISSLIKLVPGNSAGTVTTFYPSTIGRSHEEIDFEFIGNDAGHPYTFHTNLYAEDIGNKEVEFKPWFDPTAGFHNYTISWGSCMVVWYVDGVPIRVFHNYKARHGVPYPTSRPMYSYLSIWAATDGWATHGGQVRTHWSKAPFVANYHSVNLDVCWCNGGGGGCGVNCPRVCELSPTQLRQMQAVQAKYKTYDYCNDNARFKGQMPTECRLRPQY